jgi:hypothetical protein
MRYKIPATLFAETFAVLRQCGGGRRECQVLWTSPWALPTEITRVIHPHHIATAGGFAVSSNWISDFWMELARDGHGVRVQVHTHPGDAFHSATDDAYPIIHTVGFLSLVLPDFARGAVGFNGAYLAEIDVHGQWREVSPDARLEVLG